MRYAMIYSCNEYTEDKTYEELKWAKNDADELEKVLTKYYDFECFCSDPLDPYGEKTPSDILEDIKALNSKVQDGDTVLFYYSGHGEINKDATSYLVLPNTESDNLEETALSINELINSLSGNNVLNVVILDCCHSGQVIFPYNYNTRKSINGTGVVFLSACKQNEKSNEYDSIEHGIFTYSLINALKSFELNANISPQELISRVYDVFNNLEIKKRKEQSIVVSMLMTGNSVLAKRCKTYNEENIIEVLNNVEFLDNEHLLNEMRHFCNKSMNIGEIEYSKKNYDFNNNIFYFKLKDNNIIKLLNSKIANITKFKDDFLFFKTSKSDAIKIINENRNITLSGYMNINNGKIRFDDLKLKDRNYEYQLGGIVYNEAEEVVEMENKIGDFEYINESVVCVDIKGNIIYYNILEELIQNRYRILTDDEEYSYVKIYKENNDNVLILGCVENKSSQVVEWRLSYIDDQVKTKSVNVGETIDGQLCAIRLLNSSRIGFLTDKEYGLIEIESGEVISQKIVKSFFGRKYTNMIFSKDNKHSIIYSSKKLLIFDINNIESSKWKIEKYNISFVKWLNNNEIVIICENENFLININDLGKEIQYTNDKDKKIYDIIKVPNNNLLCFNERLRIREKDEKIVSCSFDMNFKRSTYLSGHNGEEIKSSLNGDLILGTRNKTIVKWENIEPNLKK